MHLATRQAAVIAAHAAVEALNVLHVSNIHSFDLNTLRDGALRSFEGFRSLPSEALWEETELEMSRP